MITDALLARELNPTALTFLSFLSVRTIVNSYMFEFAGFTCSAGIACNKLLAKVASAMNKPNQQTVVPPRCEITASCACISFRCQSRAQCVQGRV